MTRRIILAALMFCAAAAIMPSPTLAAALSTLVGDVQTVSADSFELKTGKTTVTVKLTNDTKFVQDQKPSDKTQLKAGERVVATISKGKSGEMIAIRVIVGLGASSAPATK